MTILVKGTGVGTSMDWNTKPGEILRISIGLFAPIRNRYFRSMSRTRYRLTWNSADSKDDTYCVEVMGTNNGV